MKILIVSHMFPSESRPDFGTFVLQQAEAYKYSGHEVTVICPVPRIPGFIPNLPQRWQAIKALPNHEVYNGINVFYLKAFVIPKTNDRIRGMLFYLQSKHIINKLMIEKQFDVIHAHAVLTSGDLGTYIKNRYKIPLIITIHGADVLFLAKKNPRNIFHVFNTLQKSDHIAVVSEYLKKLTRKLNIEQHVLPEISVIYNGIKTYSVYPEVEWPENSNTIKLVTIAALIERKKHHNVLDAMKQLSPAYPELHYYIIGEGWDRAAIEAKVSKLDLVDKVHFLGKMPHQKAMAYLKEADIFVLPSVDETFGVVYIESMYFGKLTIGTKGEGISEIIKNGENGFLVKPDNVNDLAETLHSIIKNLKKSTLKTVQKSARRSVWPKFSWEENANAYIKIFKKVLEG